MSKSVVVLVTKDVKVLSDGTSVSWISYVDLSESSEGGGGGGGGGGGDPAITIRYIDGGNNGIALQSLSVPNDEEEEKEEESGVVIGPSTPGCEIEQMYNAAKISHKYDTKLMIAQKRTIDHIVNTNQLRRDNERREFLIAMELECFSQIHENQQQTDAAIAKELVHADQTLDQQKQFEQTCKAKVVKKNQVEQEQTDAAIAKELVHADQTLDQQKQFEQTCKAKVIKMM
jgi:hypothetical protein